MARVDVVVKMKRWRKLGMRVQPSALRALEDMAPEVLSIVKEYAPQKSGELRDSLSVGQSQPYGPYRVSITILSSVPYFFAVVRGWKEAIQVGKAGKKYSTGSGPSDLIWTGAYVLPPRPANNFPKAAIRDNLPKILGLMKQNFVTRLKQG